ncbi:hypothetical protein [Halomonas sp. YLGW01]|uniref:hypothetical protein n=1 Tax=Halomonas sp. YLGW01 TaxID=2773308 RepID=UPI001781D4FE|nr:hypothetical protein [Halomonas sp. YLGW01]
MSQLARAGLLGATLVATTVTAITAQADVLGLTARVNASQQSWEDNHQGSSSGFQGDLALRLEHPVPLIPNIAVGAERKNQDFPGDGESVNAELYYELVDLLDVQFDAGLGAERWTLDNDGIDESDNVYAIGRASIGLPISSLGIEAELKRGLDNDSVEHDRRRAGLTYDLVDLIAVSATVAIGYQSEEMELNGTDWESDGAYLGLEIDL